VSETQWPGILLMAEIFHGNFHNFPGGKLDNFDIPDWAAA